MGLSMKYSGRGLSHKYNIKDQLTEQQLTQVLVLGNSCYHDNEVNRPQLGMDMENVATSFPTSCHEWYIVYCILKLPPPTQLPLAQHPNKGIHRLCELAGVAFWTYILHHGTQTQLLALKQPLLAHNRVVLVLVAFPGSILVWE